MKTIRVNFSEEGLKKLSAELKQYAQTIRDLNSSVINPVLESTAQEIGEAFATAPYPGYNDTSVSYEDRGNIKSISVSGSAAPYIEYGAGINQPEYSGPLPSGVSPHGERTKVHMAPAGKDHVMKPIENDSGYWGYEGVLGSPDLAFAARENADVYITEGNPPAEIILQAKKEIVPRVAKKIKEQLEKK